MSRQECLSDLPLKPEKMIHMLQWTPNFICVSIVEFQLPQIVQHSSGERQSEKRGLALGTIIS